MADMSECGESDDNRCKECGEKKHAVWWDCEKLHPVNEVGEKKFKGNYGFVLKGEWPGKGSNEREG